MNEQYENEICSVCYTKFFEDDDIVVCPICGAPYHRSCYQRTNRCKYEAYHGTEQQWDKQHNSVHKKEQTDSANTNDQNYVGITCPNCGTISSSNTLFCPNCGTPFGQNRTDCHTNFANSYTQSYRPIFSDPLGGVDPKENIDDVTAIDLAAFVGPSSQIYLPRFSKIKKGNKQKLLWNWSAFLIPEYYFLFRKCTGAAVFALTLQLIASLLQLPFVLATESYNTYAEISVAITNGEFSQQILLLFLCSAAISLISRIFFGLFGNLIYKNHSISAIKTIKKESEPSQIQEKIAKKGGVSLWFTMIGTLAVNCIYYVISWYILNFI